MLRGLPGRGALRHPGAAAGLRARGLARADVLRRQGHGAVPRNSYYCAYV